MRGKYAVIVICAILAKITLEPISWNFESNVEC